jgi:hypothetical protein
VFLTVISVALHITTVTAVSMDAFDSAAHWEARYAKGGNSGGGSYGHLARYKAAWLNLFVSGHNVKSLIEFGCGDGNNLMFYKVEHYTGFDVSRTILESTAKLFKDDVAKGSKEFHHVSEYVAPDCDQRAPCLPQ